MELKPPQQPRPLDYQAPPKRAASIVPTFRKIYTALMVAAGIVVATAALFQENSAARINLLTLAFGLVVWGLVIRFNHIRF